MARRSSAEILGANVEESSTQCEPEDLLEYTSTNKNHELITDFLNN